MHWAGLAVVPAGPPRLSAHFLCTCGITYAQRKSRAQRKSNLVNLIQRQHKPTPSVVWVPVCYNMGAHAVRPRCAVRTRKLAMLSIACEEEQT
jgi:hypothetical protein